MHIHIHALLHFIRHARFMVSYARVAGVMLLMLLFSILQLASAGEPSSGITPGKSRAAGIGSSRCVSLAGMNRESTPSADPLPLPALHTTVHAGVFPRLTPGLVMPPRTERTPKPKSVYRCVTRAPGVRHA